HGEMTHPALKSRDTPAYRTLEEWVRLTLEGNPQLQEGPVATATPLPATDRTSAVPAPAKLETPTAETPGTQTARASRLTSPAASFAEPKEIAVTPMPPSEPADPYDPIIFNRQAHPQAKSEGGK